MVFGGILCSYFQLRFGIDLRRLDMNLPVGFGNELLICHTRRGLGQVGSATSGRVDAQWLPTDATPEGKGSLRASFCTFNYVVAQLQCNCVYI